MLSNNGTNPNSPFFDDIYKVYLSTGAESFEFSTVTNGRTSSLQKGCFIAFKYRNKIKLFQIINTSSEHSNGLIKKTCYCETIGLELLNKVVRKSVLQGDVTMFFNLLLQDSSFELGYVDPQINEFRSINIEKPEEVTKQVEETKEYEYEFNGEVYMF